MSAHENASIDEFLAGELLRLCPNASERARKVVRLLTLASMASDRAGSTRLPLQREVRELERQLEGLEATSEIGLVREFVETIQAAIPSELSNVFGRVGERKPFVVVDGCLYQERSFALESKFVEALRPRFVESPKSELADVGRAIDAVRATPELSDEQARGIERALASRFALITGGPGTGKTALTVALLRVLVRLGIPTDDVALAAPTGRAAQRMVDAISRTLRAMPLHSDADQSLLASLPVPSTLHRLLDYSPYSQRFLRHERNPIPAKVVIVDEGSMIDLMLATRLIRSLREDSQLILLGDAQQLPSVETGSVFRDLVRAAEGQRGLPHVTRLTKSYRMDLADQNGKAIFEFSARVLAGDSKGVLQLAPERDRASGLEFAAAERISPSAADEAVDRFFDDVQIPSAEMLSSVAEVVQLNDVGSLRAEDVLRVRALLDHYDTARVLTATRTEGNAMSSRRVNARLHERYVERVFKEQLLDTGLEDLRPGEPVMMQRNDYARGLFNGDQGAVLRVLAHGADSPHLACIFATSAGLVAVPLSAVQHDVELAFATTVHKAQGSEFQHVLFLVPQRGMPILTRDLVYTAVTRARTSVALVADPESLARTVENRIERFSGVADRLLATISPL